MIEKIGKIASTSLGVEDHGIMTFMLMFDFGGSGQGFGGYSLDDYGEGQGRRVGTAAGLDAIMRIISACGVGSWEDIKGKIMYALYDTGDYGGRIKGIKGLPFEEGGTFLLSEWQEQWYPKESD